MKDAAVNNLSHVFWGADSPLLKRTEKQRGELVIPQDTW